MINPSGTQRPRYKTQAVQAPVNTQQKPPTLSNFRSHRILSDGDCLFRAMHMGLTLPGLHASNKQTEELRQRLSTYIENNFQALEASPYVQGYTGTQNLHDLLTIPSNWNESDRGLALPLLAQVLGREIVILQPSERGSAYSLKQAFPAENPQLPPGRSNTGQASIHLAHIGGSHYEYLEPINKYVLSNTQLPLRQSETNDNPPFSVSASDSQNPPQERISAHSIHALFKTQTSINPEQSKSTNDDSNDNKKPSIQSDTRPIIRERQVSFDPRTEELESNKKGKVGVTGNINHVLRRAIREDSLEFKQDINDFSKELIIDFNTYLENRGNPTDRLIALTLLNNYRNARSLIVSGNEKMPAINAVTQSIVQTLSSKVEQHIPPDRVIQFLEGVAEMAVGRGGDESREELFGRYFSEGIRPDTTSIGRAELSEADAASRIKSK